MENENDTTSQPVGEDINTAPGQIEMNPATAAAVVAPEAATGNADTVNTDDVSEHKLYAVLGYILPFLFFLPLLQDSSKKNEFARFHANQQLILLILLVSYWALSNVFFMILYFIWFAIAPLLSLALLVLVILGIVHAAQGEMKELPLIGKFRLIK